jgi:hypothetical protein
MKLSLNLPALERLIGGDGEIEVELRHQIVKEFTKKYLKGIVDSSVFQSYQRELLEELRKAVKEVVGGSINDVVPYN